MFSMFINKFKEIYPFYSPYQSVFHTFSSGILMAKRAIFWLFLVELFMGNSLRSQLFSSRCFIRILKLNSDIITNIYLNGKITTVSFGDYSYNKVNFYRDTSNYYMAQICELHIFAQSFRR